MTDSDNARIRQLDDKSDYFLWRLRVQSASDSKELTAAFTSKEVPAAVDSAISPSNVCKPAASSSTP